MYWLKIENLEIVFQCLFDFILKIPRVSSVFISFPLHSLPSLTPPDLSGLVVVVVVAINLTKAAITKEEKPQMRKCLHQTPVGWGVLDQGLTEKGTV